MKIHNIKYLLFYLVASIPLASCEDNDISPNEKGSLKIEFDNRFGEEDLNLNTNYVNSSGETFSIAKLNYYISNIKLRTTGGEDFIVTQDSSYFIIMEEHADTHMITIKNVPAGDYNEVTFTIGVDSLRSTMDVSKRQGVLDPAQGHDGMYWTWNSGYIFFKMEGTSPAAPANQENKFYYHIGGYGGFDSPTLNNIRETTVSFGSARAEVRKDKTPEVHLHADLEKFFEAPNQLKIADYSLVMFSEFSTQVSENYVNMFRYDHVHN